VTGFGGAGRRAALCAAVAAVLAGCSSAPQVRREVNPDAAFGQYRSFGFFKPLATDKAGYESLLSGRLKQATQREMEARGYVYADANPDLLLNFYANVEDRQEIVTTPAVGYYGYRRGMYGGFGYSTVETLNYREGTLAIDVVEGKRRILVWQATAEGIVSDEARRNPGPAIDAIVTELMTPLPPAGR
jgi:hypothetical protein